jgi:hypothetical protein
VVPAVHWQRVLHLLGLDAQQRRDTLASRRLLLDNMGKLLAERQALAQQLLAAQPSAMEYVQFTKVSLKVGAGRKAGAATYSNNHAPAMRQKGRRCWYRLGSTSSPPK